jgi:predicted transcriptional regulator
VEETTEQRPKITISIAIRPELVDLLDQIGDEQDRSRSWLIEQAIRKVYQPEDRPSPHPPEQTTE